MRRTPLLSFFLILVTLLAASCCLGQRGESAAGRRPPLPTGGRERGGRAHGDQQFSLGVAVAPTPAESAVKGMVVRGVAAGGMGDATGIKVGDIITDLAGKKVESAQDIALGLVMVARTMRFGAAQQITVIRDGQTLALTIKPGQNDGSSTPSNPVLDTPAPPKTRLLDINVLKYAIIDPKSRAITLIGKYDASYKTGPISYYDLLNDAMASPYPSFSLEPTDETRAGVGRVEKAIDADVQKMYTDSNYAVEWQHRIQNMLLNDNSLARDRARFISKGAEAFKVSDDEMLKILAKAENDSSVSIEELMPIIIKTMRGLGYERFASAFEAMLQGGAIPAFDKLGLASEAQAIITKTNTGEITKERGVLELTVLLYRSLLKEIGVSASDVDAKADAALNGRMSGDQFQQYANDQINNFMVEAVGYKMFNGLTLSHELLGKLYNISAPQMNLVFKDVPANSVLGDILFRADYALKSICTNPDVKAVIPGFMTEIDFMYDASARKGVRVTGDAGAEFGHRLIPGEVKMRVSPEGTLVAFDDAQVKIDGWMINPVGKRCTPQIADFLKATAGEYAAYLTEHYDELAGAFPQLHRIREAEKLIALARWAKANNYGIVVEKATGVKATPPSTAIGFWLAVFTANPQEISLSVIAEGGAEFDKDEGDAWIKPNTDSQVTSDVSKQLITSTALSMQAASEAMGGNMESARDLADKGARAMTGDIDLTKLPSLNDIPMPGEPAQTVQLSEETLSAIDQNLKRIEDANISMQKAADLEKTSPDEAAKMREQADAQKQQANANIKKLHDALDDLRNNPGKINDTVVTIRGLGVVTPPSNNLATNPQPSGPAVTPGAANPTASTPAPKGDLSPEEKKKLLAKLETLRNQLEQTKQQFAKLNASIQKDKQQFDDWEKVAQDGMERCSGVLYNLLMDATVGPLSERYDTMHELAQKLPDKPQDLISRLGRIKNWFKVMSYTQTFKDITDVAAKDGQTLPELLEMVRDDLNIIASVTGLDKTVVGAAWKQGTNMVEMAYSYTQFSAAYDNINQLDKNSDAYLKAVAALTVRMQSLVQQIKDVKAQLGVDE